ncbi:MAG: outer membrane beta-barrel protein [Gammaproteobacteria bacterium]|nr:outer membrane beta-barrel protein [Gammaproteobacteria bacterium]
MRRSIFIMCLLLSAISGQANAENGDQYWMVKAGLSWFDYSDSPDAMTAANITYGYGVTKNIAAELDYQQSIGGGEYSKVVGADTEKGEFAYKLFSVGAAYRHVFYESLYFRGKVAFAFGDEERTSSLIKNDTSDVTNLTGSLALGALAGDVVGSSLTLELEYIQQSSELSSLMLGANVTF